MKINSDESLARKLSLRTTSCSKDDFQASFLYVSGERQGE